MHADRRGARKGGAPRNCSRLPRSCVPVAFEGPAVRPCSRASRRTKRESEERGAYPPTHSRAPAPPSPCDGGVPPPARSRGVRARCRRSFAADFRASRRAADSNSSGSSPRRKANHVPGNDKSCARPRRGVVGASSRLSDLTRRTATEATRTSCVHRRLSCAANNSLGASTSSRFGVAGAKAPIGGSIPPNQLSLQPCATPGRCSMASGRQSSIHDGFTSTRRFGTQRVPPHRSKRSPMREPLLPRLARIDVPLLLRRIPRLPRLSPDQHGIEPC